MPRGTAKLPRDWEESDILSLITNGVKESIDLDYKDSRALQKSDKSKEGISKHVSAFANSAGGTIVYGVSEDKHVPTRIDGGLDPADISKEWLENVINSTIRPRIDGVRINQVDLRTNCPGRVLYVVEIPQTVTGGPHQASDHRYYKRFNFKSEPMEDYEVRDVMGRSRGPDLYCNVQVKLSDHAPIEEQFDLTVTIGNHSDEPALYANIDVFVDEHLVLLATEEWLDNPVRVSCAIGGTEHSMNRFTLPWVTPDMPPIWRGFQQQITRDPMEVRRDFFVDDYLLVVTAMSPRMSPRTHVFQLRPSEWSPQRRVTLVDGLHFSTEDSH